MCNAGLRLTLPRFIAQPSFRSLVRKLRGEGWKDWHILASILNGAAGFRIAKRLGGVLGGREWAEAYKDEVFAVESELSLQIPASHFDEMQIRGCLLANMSCVLANEGLWVSEGTPNIDGLRNYLKARWRYFDLDVPHPGLQLDFDDPNTTP